MVLLKILVLGWVWGGCLAQLDQYRGQDRGGHVAIIGEDGKTTGFSFGSLSAERLTPQPVNTGVNYIPPGTEVDRTYLPPETIRPITTTPRPVKPPVDTVVDYPPGPGADRTYLPPETIRPITTTPRPVKPPVDTVVYYFDYIPPGTGVDRTYLPPDITRRPPPPITTIYFPPINEYLPPITTTPRITTPTPRITTPTPTTTTTTTHLPPVIPGYQYIKPVGPRLDIPLRPIQKYLPPITTTPRITTSTTTYRPSINKYLPPINKYLPPINTTPRITTPTPRITTPTPTTTTTTTTTHLPPVIPGYQYIKPVGPRLDIPLRPIHNPKTIRISEQKGYIYPQPFPQFDF